jgi:hypothetical protein
MECLLETKAATIVEFIQGLHGPLSLTFEEGTSGGLVATFAMAQCLTTSSVVAYPGKKSELESQTRVLDGTGGKLRTWTLVIYFTAARSFTLSCGEIRLTYPTAPGVAAT